MENEVDGWIAQLSQCKQLSEADVKRLCDKVRKFVLMCDKTAATILVGGRGDGAHLGCMRTC